jgi:hypothetical protein
VQGDAGHPGCGGGPKKNNRNKKMEGQGGGEAQEVADPPKNLVSLSSELDYKIYIFVQNIDNPINNTFLSRNLASMIIYLTEN